MLLVLLCFEITGFYLTRQHISQKGQQPWRAVVKSWALRLSDSIIPYKFLFKFIDYKMHGICERRTALEADFNQREYLFHWDQGVPTCCVRGFCCFTLFYLCCQIIPTGAFFLPRKRDGKNTLNLSQNVVSHWVQTFQWATVCCSWKKCVFIYICWCWFPYSFLWQTFKYCLHIDIFVSARMHKFRYYSKKFFSLHT